MNIRTGWMIIFFVPFSTLLFAQLNNQALEENQVFPAGTENTLFFHLNNYNFLRNNEFFNPIVSGETFFGYQIAPSFVYYPNQYIRLEAGAFFWQDFGSNRYSQISPIFSLKLQKDSNSITFGTLQGNYAHRLIEPMYAFEKGIQRRLENGIQLKHLSKKFYTDLWADWQQIINPEKTIPELIWGGLVMQYSPLKTPKVEIQIPLQMTIFHIGGQDLAIDTALTNALNIAAGLHFVFKSSENRFLKSVRSESYWLINRNNTGDQLIENGRGFYSNLSFQMKPLDVMLSFWAGSDYNAFQGGNLYKSFPIKENGVYERDRRLFFLRLMRDIRIEDSLHLTLRFEPYFDFGNQLFEYSMGLYFTYQPRFFLMQAKKKR